MENLLYWLAGGIGVPLIQWLKQLLGFHGKAAMWLTAAVAVVLAVAALLISRQLVPVDFTPENLAAVFGQVLAAATLAYKLLLGEE